MNTHTVPLSRAHKIAERLKTRLSLLISDSEKLCSAGRIQGAPSPRQLAELSAQGSKVLQRAEEASRVAEVLAAVRETIAQANVKVGISAKLAELDGVNRIQKLYQSLSDCAAGGGIAPSEIEGYFVPGSESRSHYLDVQVLVGHEKLIADSLLLLQQKAMRLADEIAELNAKPVTLMIPEDISAFVVGA